MKFDTDTKVDGMTIDDLSDGAKLYLLNGAITLKENIGGTGDNTPKTDEEVLEIALRYDGHDV